MRGWPEMWPWGVVEERVEGRPRLGWVRRGEVRGMGIWVGAGGEGGAVMVVFEGGSVVGLYGGVKYYGDLRNLGCWVS